MVPIIVAIHVLLATILILLVLMHRGQGGGLSDMFGGGGSGVQGSAVVERNLDRFTVIATISFGVTNCLLVVLL